MTLLGMDDEKLKIFNTELDKKLKQLELIVTQRKWMAYKEANQNNIVRNATTIIQLDTIVYDCDSLGFTDYGYVVQEAGMH